MQKKKMNKKNKKNVPVAPKTLELGAWSLKLGAYTGCLFGISNQAFFFVYYCGMVFLVEEEQGEGVTFAKVGWQCW